MIKAECDRCKVQEETTADRFLPGETLTPLPDDWRRVFMPGGRSTGIEVERWELCKKCVNDLREFFKDLQVFHLSAADEPARKPVDVSKLTDSRWPWAVIETHPTTDREHVAVRCAEHGWSTARSFRGSEMNPTTVGNWVEEAMSIHMDMHHATPRDKTANVLDCTLYEPGGECVGQYDRGKFPEHARRYHPAASGPNPTAMGNGGVPCPFCSQNFVSPKLGQHVAAKHPGKWQEWADAQAAENRKKAAVFSLPSPSAFAVKDISES